MSDLHYYSLAEELLLGNPIDVRAMACPGICDFAGCAEDAAYIIPGARLCEQHGVNHGVGTIHYVIVCTDLVGGPEWIEARRADYEDVLRWERATNPGSARRTPERDEWLNTLIERHSRGTVTQFEDLLADQQPTGTGNETTDQ